MVWNFYDLFDKCIIFFIHPVCLCLSVYLCVPVSCLVLSFLVMSFQPFHIYLSVVCLSVLSCHVSSCLVYLSGFLLSVCLSALSCSILYGHFVSCLFNCLYACLVLSSLVSSVCLSCLALSCLLLSWLFACLYSTLRPEKRLLCYPQVRFFYFGVGRSDFLVFGFVTNEIFTKCRIWNKY